MIHIDYVLTTYDAVASALTNMSYDELPAITRRRIRNLAITLEVSRDIGGNANIVDAALTVAGVLESYRQVGSLPGLEPQDHRGLEAAKNSLQHVAGLIENGEVYC